MPEPELGGIWRQLPHEPTRQEEAREWAALDREAERAREQYIHDLRNPPLRDISERREELRASGMDGDQITDQISRERQQNISFADRLENEALEQRYGGHIFRTPEHLELLADAQRAAEERLQERWGQLERDGVHPDRIEQIIGHEFPQSSYGEVTDKQWSAGIRAVEAQIRSETQRPDYHQQARAEHDIALGSPQRFPLTGDLEHAERITTPAIWTGRQVGDGADLAAMRYHDHRSTKMEDPTSIKQLVDNYWQERLATPLTDQQKQQQQALQLASEPKQRLGQRDEVDQRQTKLSL